MKTILLAAGYGTRLRPLTLRIPKCLIEIKKQPLLQIWLNQLIKYNFGPFLINTHYLNRIVEDFISEYSSKKLVKLSHEPKLLGTAGTLLNNIDFIGNEDVCIIHADNYCLTDFSKFLDAHKNRPKNCLMTMMIFETDSPKSCGIVKINKAKTVSEFYEKSSVNHGNLANAAIYILSNEMVNEIKNFFPNAVDFSLDVIPHFIDKIYTHKINESLTDIGTLKKYYAVNQ